MSSASRKKGLYGDIKLFAGTATPELAQKTRKAMPSAVARRAESPTKQSPSCYRRYVE
jgi:hypothetical protein